MRGMDAAGILLADPAEMRVCGGGGSMKSKLSKSLMPMALSVRVVVPRLVRWISGTDVDSISF
jgi:hypothetical protein